MLSKKVQFVIRNGAAAFSSCPARGRVPYPVVREKADGSRLGRHFPCWLP